MHKYIYIYICIIGNQHLRIHRGIFQRTFMSSGLLLEIPQWLFSRFFSNGFAFLRYLVS